MGSESLTGAALDAAIENRVFRDDGSCFAPDGSERRERIKRAITESNDVWTACGESDYYNRSRAAQRLWESRHGEACQQLIEMTVAAYRAEPRPFHRDLRLAMLLVGKEFEIIASGGSVQVMIFVDGMVTGEGAARLSEFPDADEAEQRVLCLCAAICRAVLLSK